jgi:hypothetical protein
MIAKKILKKLKDLLITKHKSTFGTKTPLVHPRSLKTKGERKVRHKSDGISNYLNINPLDTIFSFVDLVDEALDLNNNISIHQVLFHNVASFEVYF